MLALHEAQIYSLSYSNVFILPVLTTVPNIDINLFVSTERKDETVCFVISLHNGKL